MPNVTPVEASKIILREGISSLPSSSDALCLAASFLDKRAVRRKTDSIRNARGYMFVDHVGDVVKAIESSVNIVNTICIK